MPSHYKGYYQAVEEVKQYDKEQLLQLLDDLFGRDNLPEDYDLSDLRREALIQLDKEWRTPEGHKQQEQTNFWLKVIRANQRYGY